MGLIKMSEGKYGEAENYFKLSLKGRPNSPGIMINLAALYLTEKKYYQASFWISKALGINPRYAPALKAKKLLKQK
jgi:tetratricopeptide (TPR) repeat protein